MLSVRKRGRVYRLEGQQGGGRIRFSLATADRDAALSRANKIERALSQGRESKLWDELRPLLRLTAFKKLAGMVGYSEVSQAERPTWDNLRRKFNGYAEERIARNKLRRSTMTRYQVAINEFSAFLAERGIEKLSEVTRGVVEDFKPWRLRRILAKCNGRNGSGLDLDLAALHRVFSFGLKMELVLKNPVEMEGISPGGNAEQGAQPFSQEELARLYQFAQQERFTFLVLRHTGLRSGDARSLTWREVDWKDKGINKLTEKWRKRVWIPLNPELFAALEREHKQRKPNPDDTVLVNLHNRPMGYGCLHERLRSLGKRAKVENVHTHRFRDSFAVSLFRNGATPYYVSKILGDNVQTIEKHYAPWLREMREDVKRFVETVPELQFLGTDRTHPEDDGELIH